MSARYSHLSPDHKHSEIEKLSGGGVLKVVSMEKRA
jgi:hypothetical protein